MATLVKERFEIVKELGRGSKGVVYLASDLQQKKSVALKVFSESSFEASDFQNEFSLLSALHDPSLAEIYDFGFDAAKKTYFLSEEYFAGHPLL